MATPPKDSADAQTVPGQGQPDEHGAVAEGQETTPDTRGRWQRYLDGRATRRDPRWPKAVPWHETQASGFRTPARMCPRGCSHEVARRELLTFSTWSGPVVVRVYFDFESTNCEKCGSRRTDHCPRCEAKILAPVTSRCEFCGLPQPWSSERLTTKRRTPPRAWEPEATDAAEPAARDPAERVYPIDTKKPKRQLLVIDDDITNLAVQTIVSNDDVDGQMYTVIASAIKAAAGRQVEELSIDHGRARLGDAWFTHPGRLSRLKGIIHVAAMDRRGKTSIGVIRDCVRSALDEAVKHDCKSVAIAAFGTEREAPGRRVITLGEWLDEVAPTIVEYLDRLPKTKKLAVILVLFEPEDFQACVARLRRACGTDR